MITLLGAYQGTGKSYFVLDIARTVIHGGPWPDGAPNKKLSIAAMAKSRKLTPTTIFNHLERLIDSGAQLNIDYLKPKEPIWQAISKAVSKHGSSRLKPIFEELNGKVDYETIKTALLIIKTKK
jgi:uncharacterized protein YpbB